jgi:polyhydroxybutyrate depolymerase
MPPRMATGLASAFLLAAVAPLGCRHAVAPGAASPADTSAVLPDSGGGEALADPAPHSDAVSLTVDGRSRHLIVHLPGGATTGPRPLVLNLHGSGATAAAQESFTAMDAVAEANGFIVAYPEAAIDLGGGFAWNVPGQPLLGGAAVPADAPDDVAFFAQAISLLEQRYAIDPRRIFVAGMSGGARMTSQLGCDLASTVAAIAPVAGLRFPSPCGGTRSVPAVSFHGTADPVNPYDGSGQGYWTYSVPSAAAQWAVHDGCGAVPALSQPAADVALTAYGGCAGGAEIALYTIAGAATNGRARPSKPRPSTRTPSCGRSSRRTRCPDRRAPAALADARRRPIRR